MRNVLLPPIVWLTAIITIFIAHTHFPIAHAEPTPWRSTIAIILIGIAIALTAWHKRLFRKIGTNVNTFSSPDKLVQTGLFKYIRNPMYLGFVVSLAALALLLGALSPWFIVLSFFILADRWYIPFEEKAMLERFGTQYQEYQARTRRWV
jgi:protein-S-isoprenylcysteine O-methyltransferase Ste14